MIDFSSRLKFPEHYECFIATSTFGVKACLISINIAGGSLLFAWDQTEGGKNLRATDFLMHNTIKLSVERGYKFVDLGTVTESGELREGWLDIKKNFRLWRQLKHL